MKKIKVNLKDDDKRWNLNDVDKDRRQKIKRMKVKLKDGRCR